MTESKAPKGILALLFFGVLMGALDISIVGPAIPSIEANLHIDSHFSSWVFTIYVLFNLVGISLFARLSDFYGRRMIYMIALSIFMLGSLLVSLTQHYDWLLVGRAVQGFGASGIFPVASALIGDLYPVEKRGRLLGMIGAVFGLAFLLGPFIAGVLLKFYSWNALFILNVPITLVLIFFSYRLLPNVKSAVRRTIDGYGIVFMALMLSFMVFGLNLLKMNQDLWHDNEYAFLFLGLSGVMLYLLYRFEKKAEYPILRFSFLAQRNISITAFVAVITGLVQSCFVFVPKYVALEFSMSASDASFMLIPFVIATAIGSPIFGRLIDRYGVKIILILGLFLTALGFVILAQSGGSLSLFYVGGIFMGLGLSVMSGSSLRYIMLNSTSPEDRAVSQGMITVFISIGQLAGAPVIGLLLSAPNLQQPFQLLFVAASGLLLAAMLLTFRLTKITEIH